MAAPDAAAAAVSAMRERVAPLRLSAADVEAGWSSDATLERFLRARKYNVDHAVAMYEKTIAFRAERGVDRLLDTFTEPRVL